MRGWILALALLASACGQNTSTSMPEAPAMDAPAPAAEAYGVTGGAGGEERGAMADDASLPPASPPPPPPPGGPAQGPTEPSPVSYLAYSYALGLEVPGARLIPMMDSHAAACRAAGPARCQLIGSNRDGDPDAYIAGSLSLRGEPRWLQAFMANVSRDAESAGGQIKTQSTSTEDLTRAIIDTEATLRAKKALRDRLQRLLESRPGRLSDLLEVERELARVQSEIDSTESNLAAMRTRVSMSALTIGYQSEARPVAGDTFEPLGTAFANFIGYIVQGIAIIVTLIAVLIPWALVIAAVGWLLMWLRKRRGGRLLPKREPPVANE